MFNVKQTSIYEQAVSLGWSGGWASPQTLLHFIAENSIILKDQVENNTEQLQNCLEKDKVFTEAEYEALGDVVNTDGIIRFVQG